MKFSKPFLYVAAIAVFMVLTALFLPISAPAALACSAIACGGVGVWWQDIAGLFIERDGRYLSRLGLQAGRLGQETTLDSNETAFFERELEYVKSKSYDIKYAELKATRLLDVSTEAGPGAEQITYYTYDQAGVAKIIVSYADDLPRSDIKGTRNVAQVYSIGTAYGYSIQEIRNAIRAGLPLEQRKANAARRANDQLVNTIGFFGKSENNILGLFNNPNVNRLVLPNDGTGSSIAWSTKTPDLILRDLHSIANNSFVLTLGVETPNIMLLPLAQYTYISSTMVNTGNASNYTILETFLRNNPFFKDGAGRVEWVNECKAAGVNTPGADIACCYRKDSDHITYEIPQPFEQFPPQQKGLEWEIPCHSRNGGVIIYYPLSVTIAEGI